MMFDQYIQRYAAVSGRFDSEIVSDPLTSAITYANLVAGGWIPGYTIGPRSKSA